MFLLQFVYYGDLVIQHQAGFLIPQAKFIGNVEWINTTEKINGELHLRI
jgi:hypothetical protein